jgi:hypothetical protein
MFGSLLQLKPEMKDAAIRYPIESLPA